MKLLWLSVLIGLQSAGVVLASGSEAKREVIYCSDRTLRSEKEFNKNRAEGGFWFDVLESSKKGDKITVTNSGSGIGTKGGKDYYWFVVGSSEKARVESTDPVAGLPNYCSVRVISLEDTKPYHTFTYYCTGKDAGVVLLQNEKGTVTQTLPCSHYLTDATEESRVFYSFPFYKIER